MEIHITNGRIVLEKFDLIKLTENEVAYLKKGYDTFDGIFHEIGGIRNDEPEKRKACKILNQIGLIDSGRNVLTPQGILYYETVIEKNPTKKWYLNNFNRYFEFFSNLLKNHENDFAPPFICVEESVTADFDKEGCYKMISFFSKTYIFETSYGQPGDWFITGMGRNGYLFSRSQELSYEFESLFNALPVREQAIVKDRFEKAKHLEAIGFYDLAITALGSILEFVMFQKATKIIPSTTPPFVSIDDRIGTLIDFFVEKKDKKNPFKALSIPSQYLLTLQEKDRLIILMDDRNSIHLQNLIKRDLGAIKVDFDLLNNIFKELCVKFLK